MERGSGGEPSAPSRPAAPPGRGGLAARGSEEAARPRRARGCPGPTGPGHRRGAAEAKLQHGARRGVRGLGRPRSRGVRVAVTKICRTRAARAARPGHLEVHTLRMVWLAQPGWRSCGAPHHPLWKRSWHFLCHWWAPGPLVHSCVYYLPKTFGFACTTAQAGCPLQIGAAPDARRRRSHTSLGHLWHHLEDFASRRGWRSLPVLQSYPSTGTLPSRDPSQLPPHHSMGMIVFPLTVLAGLRNRRLAVPLCHRRPWNSSSSCSKAASLLTHISRVVFSGAELVKMGR